MSDDDTRAIAAYLKGLAQGKPSPPLPSAESSLLRSLGKPIYDKQCASCHGAEGLGKPPHYPPLASARQANELRAATLN
jgi:cytochrome c553